MALAFKFTAETFKELFPKNKEPQVWADAINEILPDYDINTPKRVAAFLAQCGHESAGFTTLTENLNYGAAGLRGIFGKYFKDDATANAYQRQPQKIANKVYSSRMGNGDEASGDGWKYRGRGPIQLTGKDNYTKFANDMFEDPETVMDNPDVVALDKETALTSAVWFWNKNKLNALADIGDIKTMTKRINGGYIGLEDRIKHYDHALHVLGA
jgi:putative chitinase